MAEVDEADFDDPARTVPLERFVTLLECAARVTRCADFGLEFARSYDIRKLGPVGYLIYHGRTLGEGLGDYARYFGTLQGGTCVTLDVAGDVAAMGYRIDPTVDCQRRHDAEFSTAIVVQAARRICGSAWACHEIQFEHVEPKPTGHLRQSLDASVRYAAGSNRILF